MRAILATTTLAFLSACGVDGPPIAPKPKASATTGLTISGEAAVGIAQNGTK